MGLLENRQPFSFDKNIQFVMFNAVATTHGLSKVNDDYLKSRAMSLWLGLRGEILLSPMGLVWSGVTFEWRPISF